MTNVAPPTALDHSKSFLRRFGIDRAIAYAILSKGWSTIASPISMFLIINFLTPYEQGFYYTFVNVLGLTIIFELGLAFVLAQFASHEKAHLTFTPAGTLEGDPVSKGRLASLIHSAMIWYRVVGVLIVLGLVPCGLWYLSKGGIITHIVPWRGPWIFVVLVTAGTCMLAPRYTILEGCGLVAEVAKQKFNQQIVGQVVLWLTLILGLQLSSLPVQYGIVYALALSWIIFKKRAFYSDLSAFNKTSTDRIHWWKEVWPMQWRIAASFVSGYFFIQTFAPVLFRISGPIEAGKWGISWVLANGFAPAAAAWITTKTPAFGQLIAKRNYKDLDHLFFKSLFQSTMLLVVYVVVAIVALTVLQYSGHSYGARFLPPVTFVILELAVIVNHIVYALAFYLRAHKQEPFLIVYIINGVCVLSCNLILGKLYGSLGMAIGYFGVSAIVGLGFGIWVFQSKRKLWHSQPQGEPTPLPELNDHPDDPTVT